jgi:hypothetical protein
MKTIFYELNEVPRRVFELYADDNPKNNFKFLLNNSRLFETETTDNGHLSPWVTWSTLHRGVPNSLHQISSLGQDTSKISISYPTLWEIFVKNRISVGMFGSLFSSPLPKNLAGYKFYLSDYFTDSPKSLPNELSYFQALNIEMINRNRRNVSKDILSKSVVNLLLNIYKIGISNASLLKILKQLCSELINSDRLVRRRSLQAELSFDIFKNLLLKSKPDTSFFFTNHVASSMHRYWPAMFPKDYNDGVFESIWISKWKNEIPHALKIVDIQLGWLIKFCNKFNYRLIISSSMGQKAVQDSKPVWSEILITDINKLLNYIGIPNNTWLQMPTMSPRILIKPLTDEIKNKIFKLSEININDSKISVEFLNTGDILIDLNIINQNTLCIKNINNESIMNDIGISNIMVQDKSASYAYHTPFGILIEYSPNRLGKKCIPNNWQKINTLDVAPSILKSFDINVPGYMSGKNFIFT